MTKDEIIEIMKEVKPGQFAVICYDRVEVHKEADREQQMEFYLDCMRHSEGAERERYTNIFLGLKDGEEIIFDDFDDAYEFYKLTGRL